MEVKVDVAVLALVVSVLSLGVNVIIARFHSRRVRAAEVQAKAAMAALEQSSHTKLFSGFDFASQITFQNPELLYSVHGLPSSIAPEEAKRIAYLSILLDAFQHFYGELYNGDFEKMYAALVKESTFLNRLLAVEENQDRWATLKKIYYGEFDSKFIQAIERLIEHERYRGNQKA